MNKKSGKKRKLSSVLSSSGLDQGFLHSFFFATFRNRYYSLPSNLQVPFEFTWMKKLSKILTAAGYVDKLATEVGGFYCISRLSGSAPNGNLPLVAFRYLHRSFYAFYTEYVCGRGYMRNVQH